MLEQAVRNMLQDCGGMQPGGAVLLVHELPGQGYYDDRLAPAVSKAATRLGYAVSCLETPFSPTPDLPPELADAMARHPLTVFMARIGDQIRFLPEGAAQRAIVCYAIDLDQFASAFAAIEHGAMVRLRDALDAAFAAAEEIRVTCPAGTDVAGRVTGAAPPKDTNTVRFPQLVYTPLPAAGFSGTIAQRGFLVGTGSRYYAPYACALSDTLKISIEGNRITGFHGADAAAARSHYDTVSARYGIAPDFVHSWHGGIHPACHFADPASASFERWSGAAFGNPRLLHFHTCGAYAPGEISLNIVDPTVSVDGVALWEAGRMRPERLSSVAAVLERAPDLAALFDAPAQACGLTSGGTLAFA